MAPEVLKGNYDYKCDYWSLGVILYIMLSGVPPFIGFNKQQIFEQIKEANYSLEGTLWIGISYQAKKLV